MAVLVSRHAEPSAPADRAAMLASRDIMPKQTARLLSLVVDMASAVRGDDDLGIKRVALSGVHGGCSSHR
jgi:hypothetical protein